MPTSEINQSVSQSVSLSYF